MAAPITGTYTRYAAQGLREDLADVIYNISPTETPLISAIGRTSAKSTLHEWQMDALAAPDTANAMPEGFEADFVTPSPTVRVGNRTQISAKTVLISGTLEESDKAGRRSELSYQLAKRGVELRRDMEAILLSNQGSTDGSFGTARKLAGLPAWIKTNTSSGTGGVDPSWTTGVPSAGRTDGTKRGISEDDFLAVSQGIWESGGEPKVLMVGPFTKTVISRDPDATPVPGFKGRAQHVVQIPTPGQATGVVRSIDVYIGPFGTTRIMINRYQRERDAFVLDFDLIKLVTLRNFRTKPLAATGDAEKRLLLVEYSLQVDNEAGLGIVADLYESKTDEPA